MKLNFFISTIAATTSFAISTLSFFSMNPAMAATKVYAVGRCDAFNDAGKVVGKITPGYYQLVRYMRFNNGLQGAKIVAKYLSSGQGRYYTVNVINDCLQLSGNRVVEQN